MFVAKYCKIRIIINVIFIIKMRFFLFFIKVITILIRIIEFCIYDKDIFSLMF